jgi:hypothetical protein
MSRQRTSLSTVSKSDVLYNILQYLQYNTEPTVKYNTWSIIRSLQYNTVDKLVLGSSFELPALKPNDDDPATPSKDTKAASQGGIKLWTSPNQRNFYWRILASVLPDLGGWLPIYLDFIFLTRWNRQKIFKKILDLPNFGWSLLIIVDIMDESR